MLTHIAIAIVAGILGYLFGLLSPCCRSKRPLGRWHEPISSEEVEAYRESAMRATSVPYSILVGAPDIDNSAREALANYCKRREGQCSVSGCKGGKCPTKGPSPMTSLVIFARQETL